MPSSFSVAMESALTTNEVSMAKTPTRDGMVNHRYMRFSLKKLRSISTAVSCALS